MVGEGSEPFAALAKELLRALAGGDVGKGNDGPFDFSAIATNGECGVLDGKAFAVAAEEDFVVDAAADAVAERAIDRTLLRGIGGTIGMAVMTDRMHRLL